MLARLGWLLPVMMAGAVYYPILQNYFFSDDFIHFWHFANYGLLRFLLRMHGGHMYLTRNTVLAVLRGTFGMNPVPFFWFALIVHLLNVFLLYELVRLLTGSRGAATIAAGLWGIDPVLEGSLGWVSVHGHALAATFALLVLIGIARRRAGAPMPRIAPWLWGAAMVGCATSFGVGVGIALVMPAIAWLLLPGGRQRWYAVIVLAATALLVIGLYFGQQRLYLALYGEPASAGSMQLALAFARAQVGFVLALIGYGALTVLLGVLLAPVHFPGLVGAIALCGIMLLIGIAAGRAPARTVRPLLACAALALGIYGLIAAGRGPLVAASNFGVMVRTTRYHYSGAIAAAMAFGIVLGEFRSLWPLPLWLKRAALGGWAAATLAVALAYGAPSGHFWFAREETYECLTAIESVAAAAPPGMDVFIVNRQFRAVGLMFGAHMADFPGWAAVYAMFHAGDTLDGHRIHFVIADGEVLDAARHGRRAAGLLSGWPANASESTEPDAG